jgi:hypothetical protein
MDINPMIPSKGQLKRAKKRKMKEVGFSKKIVYDEEGHARDTMAFEDSKDLNDQKTKELIQKRLEEEAELMQKEDIVDKEDYKAKIKERKRKRKQDKEEQHEGVVACLGTPDDSDEEDYEHNDQHNEEHDDSDDGLDILYE